MTRSSLPSTVNRSGKLTALDPVNALADFDYARFLRYESHDPVAASELAERASHANPRYGRLLVLRAEFALQDNNSALALTVLQQARDVPTHPKFVEPVYAITLHMSGAPAGDCIAAYRTALALDADNRIVMLNLAQLLFAEGSSIEALQMLDNSRRLGLDLGARMEEHFYRLAHTTESTDDVLSRIESLIAEGGRLN